MRLEGIHHVTAITADARKNVDFYTRVLGLRLVKKTVNQDDPTAYHLFYSDEHAMPGADLTFFEYPDAGRGRPGAGMVSRIVWRVASPEALDFWQERLGREAIEAVREDTRLIFADPEGLGLELAVDHSEDEPLIAVHPEIPTHLALQGFAGVRAYSVDPDATRRFLERTLNFAAVGPGVHEARGARRGSTYASARAAERGVGGAGTVHHVAWGSTTAEHDAWRRRVHDAGGSLTPIIDRFYFRSIYFREPGGVLFEIATPDPGFTADEPLESLGERLSLPPKFEPLRAQLDRVLTPLPNPRAGWARPAASAGEDGE